VQVAPMKINADPSTGLWLPSYFTQWYGASLALPDTRAAELDASGALANPGSFSDAHTPARPGQGGNLYDALPPEACALKYGHEYEFRVRFGDLTGGGPETSDAQINDAPAHSNLLTFHRYVAPGQLAVTPDQPQDQPDAPLVQFYSGVSFTVK